MNMSSLWKAGLLVFVAVAAVACGGGGGGTGTTKPRIGFLNASFDSTALTFKIDGDVKASALGYLGSSASFIEEKQDSYDLAVQEDGSGNPDLDSFVTNFLNQKEYMVAAVGQENYGSEPLKRLRLVAPQIDLTLPNGNTSRIYFLHAFSRAAGFDTPAIDVRNPGDNPQYEVDAIDFGSTGTLTVDASTQTFVARRSGTESVYATSTFTFVSGGIYIGVVCGIENGTGTQAPKIQFIKVN